MNKAAQALAWMGVKKRFRGMTKEQISEYMKKVRAGKKALVEKQSK